MKKVLQIVLGLAIVALAYVLYDQLMTPIRFKDEVAKREKAVISRIKDIRTAEQAFKQKFQRYTGDMDSLIAFVLSDSLTMERSTGSADDSIAVAKGLVKVEKFNIPVIDTIFGRRVEAKEIRELALIPYSQNERFILNAGMLTTESKVVVPVFEAAAPYKSYLYDLNQQELINLIDEAKNVYDKYPGIKVGDLNEATNDAGNWE